MHFYGTLGPACASRETLAAMFSAGMTGIRFNLSHKSLAQCADWLQMVREVAPSGSQLLVDLQGPELRTANTEPLTLSTGTVVTLGATAAEGLAVPPVLLPALREGMVVLLDDSALALTVLPHEGGVVRCHVTRGGRLSPRKSIDIPELDLPMPTLTAGDLENLAQAVQYGVTGVMLPFVRTPDDLICLHAALERVGAPHLRIFAKLENLQGVDRLPDLLPYADEIVIARGDLGSHMPLWELPGVQRRIAAACRSAGKPFMVVTQLLHSMTHSPVPTRAEVTDIFHAVLDGAASLMLTGETAVGEYPVQAIEMLCKTANEAARFEDA